MNRSLFYFFFILVTFHLAHAGTENQEAQDPDENGPGQDEIPVGDQNPEGNERNEEEGPNGEDPDRPITQEEENERESEPESPEGSDPETNPQDVATNCFNFVHACVDDTYKPAMDLYCKGTCNKMGSDGRDLATGCAGWADLCQHQGWSEKLNKICRGTCAARTQPLQSPLFAPPQAINSFPSYQPGVRNPVHDALVDRIINNPSLMNTALNGK
ncbi:hypothetical protein DdX_10247 [Ditylenchus destructor]|uniref:ShKT domain-containing protein n=1 Tax=Ditylenchus destructor TaxID=166010 RepID=A0AAD4N367_9BILA|nr:hypothetical protein DdX_10247 [Ditylenchus destructor]